MTPHQPELVIFEAVLSVKVMSQVPGSAEPCAQILALSTTLLEPSSHAWKRMR